MNDDECPECGGHIVRESAGPEPERVAGTCQRCGHRFRIGEFGWLFDPDPRDVGAVERA